MATSALLRDCNFLLLYESGRVTSVEGELAERKEEGGVEEQRGCGVVEGQEMGRGCMLCVAHSRERS